MILCLTMVPLAGCAASPGTQALQDENATLREENASLKAEYQNLQTEHTALLEENARLKGELETGQVGMPETDTEEAYAKLEKECAAIEAELAEIRRACPPKHFANLQDLRKWVDKRTPEITQLGIKAHLELQEMALADGYIWSVSRDATHGIASYCRAGDIVYFVDIEHVNIQRVAYFD